MHSLSISSQNFSKLKSILYPDDSKLKNSSLHIALSSPNDSMVNVQKRVTFQFFQPQENTLAKTLNNTRHSSMETIKNYLETDSPTDFKHVTAKYFQKNNDKLVVAPRVQSQQDIIRKSIKHKKMDNAQQEKIRIKGYWRQLLRWQGFDSYIFLRDPTMIKEIKGVESIQASELFEPISFSQSVTFANVSNLFSSFEQEQEYFQQQRKNHLMRIRQHCEPNENKSQPRFNQSIYQLSFFESSSPTAPKRKSQMIINTRIKETVFEAISLQQEIHDKIQIEDIEVISPLSEKCIKILWKMGIFNFYVLGSYIHCLLLELYGKEKVAYYNWKRFLKVCNLQGVKTHKYKLVAYRHLAQICITLQNCDKSLIFLKKMLKLAWTVGDKNFELLAYDKISLVFYYKQDIVKAVFFHDKFTAGESEEKGSQVRSVGEHHYLLATKLKEEMPDQNSFSEDDFDLEMLIQKSNITKWEVLQKKKDIQREFRKQSKPIIYNQGHSFGKIERMEQAQNLQQTLKKLIDFKKKSTIPLGPIFKNHKVLTLNQVLRQNLDKCQAPVSFLFNQKSTNRVPQNYLVNLEINPFLKEQLIVGYKPLESISSIKKMIKIFQFDLKFYGQHQCLFNNGLEDLV